MHDPYVYPDTKTLINKLHIRDFDRLQEKEKTIFLQQQDLPLPEGQLDYNHLKAIHKHYFAEVYAWAGKERTIDIAKGNSFFCAAQHIASYLHKVFMKLRINNYLKDLSCTEFTTKLAYYFNEINAVHPFREGNGRTLRGFCNLLAMQAGYCINWHDWNVEDKKAYIAASIAGFNGDNQPMTTLFQKIVQPQTNTITMRKAKKLRR